MSNENNNEENPYFKERTDTSKINPYHNDPSHDIGPFTCSEEQCTQEQLAQGMSTVFHEDTCTCDNTGGHSHGDPHISTFFDEKYDM